MTAPPSNGPLISTARLDVAHQTDPLRVHTVRPRRQDAAIVLFSHGAGLNGASYAPLFDIWAQHGLAVLAPHHSENASPSWYTRVQDVQALWRSIPLIEAQLPEPEYRLCREAPRVAGHSFGGHTAAILMGARPRIAPAHGILSLDEAVSGLLLAPPGNGGPENLTVEWVRRAPYLDMDWSALHRPVMIVAGMRDVSPLSSKDWRWHTDAFHNAPPGNKVLAVAPQGDHYLGGIATDRGARDPALLKDVSEATAFYLEGRSELRNAPTLRIHAK